MGVLPQIHDLPRNGDLKSEQDRVTVARTDRIPRLATRDRRPANVSQLRGDISLLDLHIVGIAQVSVLQQERVMGKLVHRVAIACHESIDVLDAERAIMACKRPSGMELRTIARVPATATLPRSGRLILELSTDNPPTSVQHISSLIGELVRLAG